MGIGDKPNPAPRGLVILVNFQDKEFVTPKDTLDNMHNGAHFTRKYKYDYEYAGHTYHYDISSEGSARQYFQDQSYGQYNPIFDLIGPVTVSQNVSYYGSNNDANAPKMIKEACQLADNAGVDFFRVTVHGRSSHVSQPHQGVDALYIACQLVVALQGLATRRVAPTEPLILGVGKLHAGTTYNALAETAVLEGTTRTVTHETRAWVRGEIDRMAAELAGFYGGTAEVFWDDFASPLYNDAGVCREAAAVADGLFGPGHVKTDRALSLSGDNFAEFLLAAPGMYAYLGTGNPEKPRTMHPNHNGNFDLDEDVLAAGAALLAACALSRLEA